MNWFIYALGAITAVGFSDIFRKLGSNLRDPFFSNLVFQIGTFSTAIVLYLAFSRRIETGNTKDLLFAFVGGVLISIFTTFSFKALSDGPGVSIVMPVMRVGGVMFVAILGILLLKEKFTLNTFFGLVLSGLGIYLLFSQK